MADTGKTRDDEGDERPDEGDGGGEDERLGHLYVRMPRDIRTSLVAMARAAGVPAGMLIAYQHLRLLEALKGGGDGPDVIAAWYRAYREQHEHDAG